MPPETSDHFSMMVWCTVIPPEELGKLVEFEDDLRAVNQTYEDWLVSMRGKPLVGSDTGVLLDRIRILMINIGIACAMNRDLAEEIQTILSTNLRKRALDIVSELSDESTENWPFPPVSSRLPSAVTSNVGAPLEDMFTAYLYRTLPSAANPTSAKFPEAEATQGVPLAGGTAAG